MKAAIVLLTVLLVATCCLASHHYQTRLWIFRDDCYAKYLNFDLSDMDCHKFTISKGLGFAIIAGSCILKVPQILKITKSGSVYGITAISIYSEIFNFTNTIANSVRLNLPFSVYGEGIFIQIQNAVITWLVWKYNKSISTTEKIIFVLAIATYSFVLFDGSFLTEEHWGIIATSCMGLTVLSRVP